MLGHHPTNGCFCAQESSSKIDVDYFLHIDIQTNRLNPMLGKHVGSDTEQHQLSDNFRWQILKVGSSNQELHHG